MHIRAWTSALAIVLLTTDFAHAAETIVGTWAPDPTVCAPRDGMVVIGPKSLEMGEHLSCGFGDVARSGYVVTWHGYCETRFRPDQPATVIAEQRGELLYVRINGVQNGPYLRCRPE